MAEQAAAREALAVADVVLAQALHVVHVQAHHVAGAALEEDRVRAGLHRLGGVAAHEAQRLHALDHRAAGELVHVAVGHARRNRGDGSGLRIEHQVVELGLQALEAAARGDGARDVGRVAQG